MKYPAFSTESGLSREFYEEGRGGDPLFSSGMLKKKDIRIEYFRASGPGGQRRNKKETAVRVTHLPTGISALGTESRHRSRNLKAALSRLRGRLDAERRCVKARVPTRPNRSALERRLVDKKFIGRKKSLRGKVDISED